MCCLTPVNLINGRKMVVVGCRVTEADITRQHCAAGLDAASMQSVGPVTPEVTRPCPVPDVGHAVPSVPPARPTVTALARRSTPVKSTTGQRLYGVRSVHCALFITDRSVSRQCFDIVGCRSSPQSFLFKDSAQRVTIRGRQAS